MRAHFGILWLFGGAASSCSIRWFDKVAPVGIPFCISRLAPNGPKAPSIYRNKAVLARRRTASAKPSLQKQGLPARRRWYKARIACVRDGGRRLLPTHPILAGYSEAPLPKRRRMTPAEAQ